MRVFHRQAVEDHLVDMAHNKDAAAKSLLTQTFYGTPGSLVGVIVCNPKQLSIVFLARATHPDEPIPHFRNLNFAESSVLDGAIANLQHHFLDPYLTPDEFRRVARSLPRGTEDEQESTDSAVRASQHVIDKIPETTRVLVIPMYGFLALNPDGIIARLEKPAASQEVYTIWRQANPRLG